MSTTGASWDQRLVVSCTVDGNITFLFDACEGSKIENTGFPEVANKLLLLSIWLLTGNT